MSWIDCVVDDDYEILMDYPYDIRKKSTGEIVKEWYSNSVGYVCVYLNGIRYGKHIIIAKNFIRNDEPLIKTEVEFIDEDEMNCRIGNLRWISPSQLRNKERFYCSDKMNKNARCFIGYVIDGNTITDEVIEKLKSDKLSQYANELGEYTKENLIKFMEYVKSLLSEDEQSMLSLDYHAWRFRYYRP